MNRAGVLSAWSAVVVREWLSLVGTPIGWVGLAAFALPGGAIFAAATLAPGVPASLRLPLQASAWCLFVAAPVLAMRSIAEERRAGTWDTLLASPAGAFSIVLGKLTALAGFLLLFALPLAVEFVLLSSVARPDAGEFLCGLLGVLLAGLAVTASALWMSALAPGPFAAYLLTIGLWSAWLLAVRALPALLPTAWVPAAFALDPIRRIDDFLIGILDSGAVALFAGIIVLCTLGAVDAVADGMRRGSRARRLPARLAWFLGVAVAVAAFVGALGEPALRARVDLTRARAWTLSAETVALVSSLEESWRIEAIVGPDSADADTRRQLDEVLARFDGLPTRGGRLSARRIDPTDPRGAADYERALEQVETVDAEPLRATREAIEAGTAAFERLAAWAAAEANALAAIEGAASIDGGPALAEGDRATIGQIRTIAAKLASDARGFAEGIAAQMRSSERDPLGDPEGAAERLSAALRAWSQQLAATEAALQEMRRRERLPPALADYLRAAPKRAHDMAEQVAIALDRVARRPELALAEVAAALRGGDAVIVTGPGRAAAIPGWQVLPPAAGGAPGFDRRFRGEQVLAAALRSLREGTLPEVIVVHGESRSLLKPVPDRADLSALADALRAARCVVREWQPADEPRPLAKTGREQVFVIVPPLRRAGLEPDARERRLLEASQRLIESGAPVLVALVPSVLPLLGQPDPWAAIVAPLGVTAKTGTTVLELVPSSEREREVRAFFELTPEAAHPVSRSASGMAAIVSEPVPLELPADRGGGATAVLEIPSSGSRWIEDDWRRAARETAEVPAGKRFAAPVAVLAAIDRPSGPGRQRLLVSGGAGWLLSGLADLTGSIGPSRVFLRYPANRELMVSAVAWLSGRDEALAAGSGREVERVPVLSATHRALLALAAAPGLSLAALLAAFAVRRIRRRS